LRVDQENVVRLYGEEGQITLPVPWTPSRDGGASRILLQRTEQAEAEEIVFEAPPDAHGYLYTLEADNVAAHLAERQSSAMTWADTLGNMQTLDRWRENIALTYPTEGPEHTRARRTIAGHSLRRRPDHGMKYGAVPGLSKLVSRLVLGCDNQATYAHATAMFDGFVEQGGNCFDTAYAYSDGLQERLFGQWLRNRAELREELVVIGKGAHTPFCDPTSMTSQLHESLERLQTDHVDIYLLHRDNPDIPAAEFVEVLNEHHRAGRIGAFGGSNWSLTRVREANDYAAARGLQPFTAVSNNLSLAKMIDAVWPGCVTVADQASRAWFAREQLALFAWSSQARGFFLPAPPTSTGNNAPTEQETARCWHSAENFQRRERAFALAADKGVSAINVALAYVLCQPFPTFALCGPRNLEELRTSLPALGLELSADELAWLNLERDDR
jgi:aryl-alcohol dehydrogenase-like predicted oxidoreductase